VVPTGCLGGSIWSSPTIDVATGMVYVSNGVLYQGNMDGLMYAFGL
jgi:hypothetical protein